MVLKNNFQKIVYAIVQLVVTVLLFSFLPAGIIKPIALLLWWWISFGKLTKNEIILFISCAIIFSLLNLSAVQKGHFSFTEENFLRAPYYEFLMWGFYFLFATRYLVENPIKKISWKVWSCITIFLIAFFGAGKDYSLMLVTTSIILAGSFLVFRTKQDFISIMFFIVLGMFIECSGVYFGQWSYAIESTNILGAPIWLVPFWGGIGFLFYRVISPLFRK